MHHRFILGLLLLALGIPAIPVSGAGDPGLAPEIREHLAEAIRLGFHRPPRNPRWGPGRGARSEPAPVWVFFTDKGIGTRESFDRAAATFARNLDPHARRRREALGPDLGITFSDLPVHAPYLRELQDRGFRIRRVSRWLNAASLLLEPARREELGALPFVRFVQPVLVRTGYPAPLPVPEERPRQAPLEPRSTGSPGDSLELAFYGSSYGQLDQIGITDLHRLGYTGAGVRVMMLDTGFRKDHPVFADLKVVAEWDFVNEDPNTQNEAGDVSGQHDHGTGTWAVLGGYAPGSLIGPAFAAEFVLAKTEDLPNEVHAEEDNYVAALEWGDSLGVEVTSASLAYFDFDDGSTYTLADLDGNTAVITVAVDLAVAKGIACVNSASNDGPSPSSIWTPADADSVIAVGAVDASGSIAAFSSRGPTADLRIKPEIVAQGVSTRWAVAATLGYGSTSGTSLSCPLIGGLAALLKEAHPEWTGARIREAIMLTGSQALTPDNDRGYGLAVAADALVQGGDPVSPPRMTGPFRLEAPAHQATLTTFRPTFLWCASAPGGPEPAPTYRVLVSASGAFTSPDTLDAGPDTTLTASLPAAPGTTWWWRVEAVGDQGFVRRSQDTRSFTIDQTLRVGPGPGAETGVRLLAAFPNPSRRETRFGFSAPAGEPVVIDVLTVTGRRVRRFERTAQGGPETLAWDGRDELGASTGSGIYFYRLESGSVVLTRKLLRLP